jgi:hypothetical protein
MMFWAMWLITYVTLQMFADVTAITTPAAAAYATAVGLLSVAIGFYIKKRYDEDK